MDHKYPYAVFNINQLTTNNTDFRKCVVTGAQMQIVVMNIKTNEQTTLHSHVAEQFVNVVSGKGTLYVADDKYDLNPGSSVLIAPNVKHNIIASQDLQLYTIYSPANHKIDTLQKNQSSPY